jgi:hypothetical protein
MPPITGSSDWQLDLGALLAIQPTPSLSPGPAALVQVSSRTSVGVGECRQQLPMLLQSYAEADVQRQRPADLLFQAMQTHVTGHMLAGLPAAPTDVLRLMTAVLLLSVSVQLSTFLYVAKLPWHSFFLHLEDLQQGRLLVVYCPPSSQWPLSARHSAMTFR